MNGEIPVPNRPLSPEEWAAVNRLSAAEIEAIDATILAQCAARWFKVARIVNRTENELRERFPDLSYVFYARRLAQLVAAGRLESQGNLAYMRFSEVRLATDQD